jgi:hypothetical protein
MVTRNFRRYSLFLIMMLFLSCIRRINPPIRESAPIIVVEGMITTDSIPYVVKLSYTGNFTNASVAVESNQNFINDARVVIKDDVGDSALCYLISPGTYQCTDPNFVGIIGRSYTLGIYLSNGKTYISSPEKINPVPPIDSMTVVYDSTYITDVRPTQFIVSVNSQDPPDVRNYYRWTGFGYIPRKSIGTPCGPLPPCAPNQCGFLYACKAQCEQLLENNQIKILSDQLINGHEIIQQVFYSPIYWFGKHFIEIKQHSINQDLYLFWVQYLEQTNNTGGILDPLPASLIGNIHNAIDSNDIALGYFEASAVASKRIVITPYFLQQYYLLDVASEYIIGGDCQMVYPNALPDDTEPPGWENAQEIDIQ